ESAVDLATTVIHSAATGVPMCCALGNTCVPFDVSSASTCLELGGAPGGVGTGCDGVTGGCVPPPASPGPCCDVPNIGGCIGGPGVPTSDCGAVGGAFSVGICTVAGCVP